MPQEYKYNHYVPEWYQKNFIPASNQHGQYYYLKLKPTQHRNKRNELIEENPLRFLSPCKCFAQNNLYTTRFNGIQSREIERLFFGSIDNKGKYAVDHFANYQYPDWRGEPLHDIVSYMSTQKLRTTKGLDWLSNQVN